MRSFHRFRYAILGLRKSPGFALTTILILGLGIGLTSAIFSVIYGVLLKAPAYYHPDHLYLLWKSVPKKNIDRDWTSYPTYHDWARAATSFEDLAAFLRPDGSIVNLSEEDSVEQVQSAKVSGNFFAVLGTPAALGRTFTAADVGTNANLAVVSDHFWRQHFAAAPDAIGKKLEIDNASFQVIGVMPRDFAFPAKESQAWSTAQDTEIWIPINSDPRWASFQNIRLADAFGVVGRLRAQATPGQAQAEMSAFALELAREHPETDLDLGIHVIPLSLYLVGPRVRLTLVLFVGAVVLVLLIACANVAGLFFSRTFAQRKSLAIQIALGAQRQHLLKQTLAEALVLSIAAAVIGLGLATLGVKALILVAPPDVPGLQNVTLNGYVLLFTLGVSVLSGILSSVVPAWKFSAVDPHDSLRERSESGRHGNRVHAFLVFIECALAIVLLAATGLLLRSAIRLHAVDLGFRPDHLVSVNLFLHGRKYDDDAQIRGFVDEVIRRTNALPGVKSAAFGSVFLGRLPNSQLIVEGRPETNSRIDDEPATWTYVSEAFFDTVGIPLLRGRYFTSADGPTTTPVVILSQGLARRLWPGQDPIGKRFKYSVPGYVAKAWLTVVGVVGDTVQNGPETRPISVIYYPVRQKVWDALVLMVRTYSNPGATETAISAQIHQIDKTIPRVEPSTVDQQLWKLGSQRRFQIELLTLFSFFATVLAGVGLYAVMSYAVGQRSHEIGIRMALGAKRADVLFMVMCQGLFPVALGLTVGIGIAVFLGRAFAGLLYATSPMDPMTYLGVCALLLGIAAIASYLPARRAMRVDPLVALRCE